MKKLKIEIGKSYETKDGAVFKITRQLNNWGLNRFISTITKDSNIHTKDESNGVWFNEFGQYGRGDYTFTHITDLVKEHQPIKLVLPLP